MRAPTPDQIRLRAELAAARERIIVLLRVAVGPSLSGERAQALVQEARAWSGPNAFGLLRYLAARGDALSAPGGDCPMSVVRLIALLAAAGYGAKVALVVCVDCGRTDPLPGRTSPRGRQCTPCAVRSTLRPCARCGKTTRMHARRPEGGICKPCRNQEPDARKECAGCHRMMVPDRRLPGGTHLCQSCAPRKLQTCSGCGRERRVNAWTATGPVCISCYSSPVRRCGICGQTAPISKRANGNTPDTCRRCYKGQPDTCNACGKVSTGHRIHGGWGPFHCRTCTAREARTREPRACRVCNRVRTVKIVWPMGPVCGPCYRAARVTPAACTSCGRQRILIGRSADGGLQCSACCLPGEPPERCTACGEPADLLPGHRCPRCTLHARVRDLLSADGASMRPALQPLAAVLTGSDNPYPILAWLRRSPAAHLLGTLASQPDDLDHAALDALPHGACTASVRGLLVTAGLLPPRDENVALLTRWVARTVTRLPPAQATVIRPFAEWHILRDARRRSARGRYSYAAHKGDCTNIRAAIHLLNWLGARNLPLQRLDQRHLDTWATDRPCLRSCAIPFIRWATARRLTSPDLVIEHRPFQLPGQFLVDDVHHAQLRRCLHDTALPLDVRVTAALVRLYALPLTRIVELTADQLHRDAEHTYLTIHRHPVLLPPTLARLIDDQLHQYPPAHRTADRARHLVPGPSPGLPRNPAGLAAKLHQHGLPVRAARNTAMMEAVADLPPMVLADLLGIAPRTAERWAALAGGSWSHYLAARPG
ncbi:XRE family transcriptional regulator [Streptomyces sp. H10-C2]|uniref:XRE family transcriptional regulator n=1 Tax=unclassified Streptomyces TaxID=2593676 RepID=UPI0024B88C0A|nr:MULTISPECIES: XRE family transcriptional regulator [unclassified Streptomyces]MDJ0346690.1 XRE family transcriptional regulator [Streptomyces sp. PH10-H1]MDJ0374598.1 XRE family transcriptional regulator [Streptomyces sp. H10-C2]